MIVRICYLDVVNHVKSYKLYIDYDFVFLKVFGV